eukprot:5197568-Amphidinium_carterae.1
MSRIATEDGLAFCPFQGHCPGPVAHVVVLLHCYLRPASFGSGERLLFFYLAELPNPDHYPCPHLESCPGLPDVSYRLRKDQPCSRHCWEVDCGNSLHMATTGSAAGDKQISARSTGTRRAFGRLFPLCICWEDKQSSTFYTVKAWSTGLFPSGTTNLCRQLLAFKLHHRLRARPAWRPSTTISQQTVQSPCKSSFGRAPANSKDRSHKDAGFSSNEAQSRTADLMTGPLQGTPLRKAATTRVYEMDNPSLMKSGGIVATVDKPSPSNEWRKAPTGSLD